MERIQLTENKTRISRGISLDVWNARPYERWTGWDYAAKMDEAYAGLTGYQRGYMKRLAKQKPGWIMHRHAVPGAPKIYPEIRPDDKVETGPPTMHWHGIGDRPALPPNKGGAPGAWSPEGGWHDLGRGSVAWKAHCTKINKELEQDGAHELVMEPHTHDNKAKYVFPGGVVG